MRGQLSRGEANGHSRCLGRRVPTIAVFEDALAGVEAARSGDFGFVVGIDRADAHYVLKNPDEVQNFLQTLVAFLRGNAP